MERKSRLFRLTPGFQIQLITCLQVHVGASTSSMLMHCMYLAVAMHVYAVGSV